MNIFSRDKDGSGDTSSISHICSTRKKVSVILVTLLLISMFAVTLNTCSLAEEETISYEEIVSETPVVSETPADIKVGLAPYFVESYIIYTGPTCTLEEQEDGTITEVTIEETIEEVPEPSLSEGPGAIDNTTQTIPYNSYLHTGTFVIDDGYVNGSKTSYPYCIQLSYEDQEFLWNLCQEYEVDYNFFLATIYCESLFKPRTKHTNSNGTVDRGICQVNSCWVKKLKNLGFITCADDLFDMHACMRCGMYIMSLYTDMFGSVERAYAAYNTGNPNINSNKNSRRVMRAYEQFVAQITY